MRLQDRWLLCKLIFTLSFLSRFIYLSCTEEDKYLPPVQPNFVDNGDYDDYANNPDYLCARRCIKGAKPKICYYKMVAERYTSMNAACGACPLVKSDCSKPQCVAVDGVEKMICSINRQVPAPSIQVCQGDTIVVEVQNKIKGCGFTIHWHGIRQIGTQYMDGVPMVTQCPIMDGQSFTYKFLADLPGTYFYHSHVGVQKVDGCTGSLIIRQPVEDDPNGHLYQFDKFSHHVFIQDWMHMPGDSRWPGLIRANVGQTPDSYIINGKGCYNSTPFSLTATPIQIYHVKAGGKYRMRFIGSSCLSCEFEVSIEKHDMIAISTDDRPAAPVKVNKMHMSAGERFDVVVNTNKPIRSYWIMVRGLISASCRRASQVAVLRYEGATSDEPPTQPFLEEGPTYILNPKGSPCNEESLSWGICVDQMRSRERTPHEVLKKVPDMRILKVDGFHSFLASLLHVVNNYQQYFSPASAVISAGMFNNISYIAPPSPPLSQLRDIPREVFCKEKCDFSNDSYCQCFPVERIPRKAVVEMVLCDGSGANLYHPMHIHGQSFYVLKIHSRPNGSLSEFIGRLNEDLQNGNYLHDHLPLKDTVAIPPGGCIVVRMFCYNPGFWLFHCHFTYHFDSGMGHVFWVGELSDLPPVPKNFPRCGSFSQSIQHVPKSHHDIY